MFGLLSRVNAREQIVGWYATAAPDGTGITDASSLIHASAPPARASKRPAFEAAAAANDAAPPFGGEPDRRALAVSRRPPDRGPTAAASRARRRPRPDPGSTRASARRPSTSSWTRASRATPAS